MVVSPQDAAPEPFVMYPGTYGMDNRLATLARMPARIGLC